MLTIGIIIGLIFGMFIIPHIILVFIKKFAPDFNRYMNMKSLLNLINIYKDNIYFNENKKLQIVINNLKKDIYIDDLNKTIEKKYKNLGVVNLYK